MTPRIADEDTIMVTINGAQYRVPKTFSETTLADYLRVHLQLSGTKVMCREGGCGVCTVLATFPDPSGATKQKVSKSINACLCLILSCDGWEITTVEGLGNQQQPHPIQTALTEHYGTQCGYCTPGMLMRMYSLLKTHPNGTLTKQIVEDSLGGNICRCTGYRPILEAFKTFARDGKNCNAVVDLEDIGKLCKTTGKPCAGRCQPNGDDFVRPLPVSIAEVAAPWYKPTTLPELYELSNIHKGRNPYYVVGRTGVGVFNDAPYTVYIDMKGIQELYAVSRTANSIGIGAAIPITDIIDLFYEESVRPGFSYLKTVADNLGRIASPSLRNGGSWGGNLAMKNRHKDFPSDTFISFIISGAKIITGPDNVAHTMEHFVEKLVMDGKVMVRAEFPAYSSDYVFAAYKIMPRNSNAHALVNGGFRAKVDKKNGRFIITERPLIVFGNITEEFMHAEETENYLIGKDIGDVQVLQQALSVLNDEVQPVQVPAESTPTYKRALSLALFYKFALEIVGKAADPRYRLGPGYLPRAVSSGTQSFPTKKELWPLTQPMPKSESLAQCTGEAKYISDIEQEGMLYAAFTLSVEGNATFAGIDTSEAQGMPGVVKIYTAADIPGTNSLNPTGLPAEEFLADKVIKYSGQPVAFVVALTRDAAEEAAKRVKIMFTNVRDAIVTCEDAIRENSFFQKHPDIVIGDAEAAVRNAPNRISGELDMGSQAHFHMETQVCVTYPIEDGFNVEAGTQFIDATQTAIAQCIGITKNRISVTVRRNGGGFGAKATRNSFLAAATAMAAHYLRRPVKMHMSVWDNFKVCGKRFSYYTKYQAGFDNNGKLLGIILDVYRNTGAFSNMFTEMPIHGIIEYAENVYFSPAWKIGLNSCKTNTPGNTWCRAPASTEAVYFMETMMEHIGQVLRKPAIDIKTTNFLKDGDTMMDGSILKDCIIAPITNQLLDSSSYKQRLSMIEQFNQSNRWRKRGMSVVPMRYPASWNVLSYSCFVAIYHDGGTVAVTHGGIELGQGINTKVAQVVAYEFGINIDKVIIQPTTAMSAANSFPTANSTTSEMVCLAAMNCCEQLKARMKWMKAKQPKATWEEMVEQCYFKGIDLSCRAWVAPRTPEPSVYATYAAMCTEVELDVLTGEYQINRCDVLYDCGQSMSPLIDVGQVEGAILMGFGYFTSEEIIQDKKTGEMLTIGTWKYKPPTAKDIPIDLRVALLQNAPNPSGILRSKIVAEPPLCMSSSVVFALRDAITASKENRQEEPWFRMEVPVTVERAQQYCNIDYSQYRYSD